MLKIGRLQRALALHTSEFCVGALAGSDVQERLFQALRSTASDRPHRRGGRLSPVFVCWLALCLPLHRSTSIENVLGILFAGWRRRNPDTPLRPVTDSAVAHARRWLGPEPLRRLFEDLASDVRPEATFHGRRVWAVDGVHATVPDTPANAACFGRHGASRGRSAFPQVHLVTLSAARTHELRAALWRPHNSDERQMGLELLQRLGPGDLVILDRGFYDVGLLATLQARGIDFLVRVPRHVRAVVRRRHARGDFDVDVFGAPLPRAQRRPGDARRPSLRVRLVQYVLPGGETVRLATSLRDLSVPAEELVRLYHERWEAELGYDEIKTHLSTVSHGTLHTVFRGRSPRMVEQEIWATLALYNLVRRLLVQAAELHEIDPRQISFTDALVVIRQAAQDVERADLRALVPLYVRLMSDLGECRMRRWRRPRRGRRCVKVKMSNYALRHPDDHCTQTDFLAGLRLTDPAA